MNNLFDTLSSQIIALFASIAIGFFGNGWYQKRKSKAEAAKAELENKASQVDYSDKIIQTWEKGFSDLKDIYTTKYDALHEQYTEMRCQYADTRKELDKLKDVVEQNIQMQEEIEKLQKKVKFLECENNKLKMEVEKLKS